jgi:hypothetical protein
MARPKRVIETSKPEYLIMGLLVGISIGWVSAFIVMVTYGR